MTLPAALVFDAYGTLFDVHSVTALADEIWPGQGARRPRSFVCCIAPARPPERLRAATESPRAS